MADTPAKRNREAKKRRNREIKAERKRLRKEGLLGRDNTGLFGPGEVGREIVDMPRKVQAPVPETPPADAPPVQP